MAGQPRGPGAGHPPDGAGRARAQVYWELHCIGLRCGKSDADGRLPRDALLRNPVADALDDGWWHGCLGRPLGVQC